MRTIVRAATLLGAALLGAQERVEFDAASIKPNQSLRVGLMIDTTPNGEFTGENVTLRNLIAFAYNRKDFQVAGGPKWMDTEHYDVVAKPPHAAESPGTSWQALNDRNRERLKTLLADRFQLVVHPETKDLPVYVLVIARNGPHLDAAKSDSARQGITGQRGMLIFNRVSMKVLAEWGLAPRLGNIVLDKTGLPGEFDFKLQFADESPVKPGAPAAEPASDPAPSLEMALQQQLGLRLETQKAPVEVIVVDRAEKASAN